MTNTWELPHDYPVQGIRRPERGEDYMTSDWRIATEPLWSSLSEDEQSWAWWKYELKETYAAWKAWFESRHKRPTLVAESTA